MKHTLLKEHFQFFNKNRFLEIHHPISLQALGKCCREAKQLLEQSPSARSTREVWRSSPAARKLALNKNLGSIASNLFMQKRLCIGYDQLFHPTIPLAKPLLQKTTLETISSIQTVCGALIFCLLEPKTTTSQTVKQEDGLSVVYPFPQNPQTAMFIASDCELTLAPFMQQEGVYYMIVYMKPRSVYRFTPKDPFTHLPKEWNYNFGDCLNFNTHPIVTPE